MDFGSVYKSNQLIFMAFILPNQAMFNCGNLYDRGQNPNTAFDSTA